MSRNRSGLEFYNAQKSVPPLLFENQDGSRLNANETDEMFTVGNWPVNCELTTVMVLQIGTKWIEGLNS